MVDKVGSDGDSFKIDVFGLLSRTMAHCDTRLPPTKLHQCCLAWPKNPANLHISPQIGLTDDLGHRNHRSAWR